MNLADIDWDLENAGEWPFPAKVIAIVIMCLLLGGGWYYLDTKGQLEQLDQAQHTETQLKKQVEDKLLKAVKLPKFKAYLMELDQSLGQLLRQLPDSTELPDVLVDISQTGLATGLEFQLFQPQAEALKDFYAELPIRVRVAGSYGALGEFVSALAALPRIVTIHDIKINILQPNGPPTNAPALVMDTTLKTYRQLDQKSIPTPSTLPRQNRAGRTKGQG